ncbi:MAG: hypothetical protein JRG97_13770 [Deltaproteobacteria bacterium]|nr:hypothetical protein [Deltaproteobacteria bacterium]MBW2053566.1 hypothetical protein [Deltaproteobacteria bacterium]MBW2142113.1 hypothetical protein [Deltaproteobacteria bacterium]
MHDIPDTEEADAAAERYWPEGYKEVIRAHAGQAFEARIHEAGAFKAYYEKLYADKYDDFEQFIKRLAEMVAIGAENGADAIFEEIYASFRNHASLPDPRVPARYYWPEPFTEELKGEIRRNIFKEYSRHHAYEHIHEDHYAGILDFESFVKQVASLVVIGAVNGADEALGRIYLSFLNAAPLPPARRRPKRIR